MKDDKENDIEMNDGDSTESPADGNNMHANPESEKKPHNRKVIAAICGLALVALIDKLVCTTCGATKDAPQATSDAAK